ncbi:ABC transporter permease [Haladaptatus sp. DFWS20]|uniref:ABC transporter permease n=1 Tax=Haladaptatus sp. DFWS20 TaxID=3403467 RepID=UPI003EBF1C1B
MAIREYIAATDGFEDDEEGPSTALVLVAGAIAAAVLSPMLWVFARASRVGANEAVSTLVSGGNLDILLNSVALVASVTAGSLLLGVPLAVLTAGSDLPFRRFWTVTAALPLVIPSYIGAFAFVSAFGPHGVLKNVLAPLGVTRITEIYGFPGATLVLTLFVYPYVFLTTRAALMSLDGQLVEAARTLNHGRLSAFRRVVLPQLVPGISAGALLVALYALSDFGTPAIMRFEVFTQAIFVESNAFNPEVAALLSLQLVVVTVAVLALESQLGDAGETRIGSGGRSGTFELGVWKLPAVVFCAAVAFMTLVVPLGILVMWLFRPESTYGGGFTFEWTFAFNTVVVAGAAAIACVVGALPVGYLSARSDARIAKLANRATYVGYAVPGIVLGFALVSASQEVSALYQSIPVLLFAYVVRFLPQAVGTVRSSVLQVDPRLIEAARTLDHPPSVAFCRVTLPLIAPGIAAGAALVFLTTMRELPATLMLHPTDFDTIVTYIWLVRGAGYYGQAAIPALVLVAISGLSMVVILAKERYNVE